MEAFWLGEGVKQVDSCCGRGLGRHSTIKYCVGTLAPRVGRQTDPHKRMRQNVCPFNKTIYRLITVNYGVLYWTVSGQRSFCPTAPTHRRVMGCCLLGVVGNVGDVLVAVQAAQQAQEDRLLQHRLPALLLMQTSWLNTRSTDALDTWREAPSGSRLWKRVFSIYKTGTCRFGTRLDHSGCQAYM